MRAVICLMRLIWLSFRLSRWRRRCCRLISWVMRCEIGWTQGKRS